MYGIIQWTWIPTIQFCFHKPIILLITACHPPVGFVVLIYESSPYRHPPPAGPPVLSARGWRLSRTAAARFHVAGFWQVAQILVSARSRRQAPPCARHLQ